MTALRKASLITGLVFTFWLAGLVAFVGVSLARPQADLSKQSDAIVVLTGGSNRIETGIELFSEGSAPELFITGVHETVTKEELLSRWKGQQPLPSCCVTIGYKATSTTENAAETKEWMAAKNFKTIRLVTSDYHMNRALLEMRHALPGVKILAHPIVQPDLNTHHTYFWHVIFGEYHKTLFRFFTILLEDLTR